MWAWNVSRHAFSVATVLAALAFSSSALFLAQPDSADDKLANTLEAATWTFVIIAGLALLVGLAFLLVAAAVAAHAWWTPVQLRGVEHFCIYWSNLHRIRLIGVQGEFRPHVTDAVRYEASVEFGDAVAELETTGWSRLTEFPETSFATDNPPNDGDAVRVTLRFRPKWWQGRPLSQEISATVQINSAPAP